MGISVYRFIEKIDHWIAFILLSFIGTRIICSALKGDENSIQINDPTKGGTMVMLSLATSIDALAVGLSISMLQISICRPAVIIGFVAFIFTAIGIHLGRIAGSNFRLGQYAEIIGGIVLLGIGVRILYEHGVFLIFRLNFITIH